MESTNSRRMLREYQHIHVCCSFSCLVLNDVSKTGLVDVLKRGLAAFKTGLQMLERTSSELTKFGLQNWSCSRQRVGWGRGRGWGWGWRWRWGMGLGGNNVTACGPVHLKASDYE